MIKWNEYIHGWQLKLKLCLTFCHDDDGRERDSITMTKHGHALELI